MFERVPANDAEYEWYATIDIDIERMNQVFGEYEQEPKDDDSEYEWYFKYKGNRVLVCDYQEHAGLQVCVEIERKSRDLLKFIEAKSMNFTTPTMITPEIPSHF